jgi:YD repeat-containing protein
MKRALAAMTAAGAIATGFSAQAQVTQTYTYDANGRLVAVATSSSGGSHASSYTYDDANNRTARSQVGTGVFASLDDGFLRFAAIRIAGERSEDSSDLLISSIPEWLRRVPSSVDEAPASSVYAIGQSSVSPRTPSN